MGNPGPLNVLAGGGNYEILWSYLKFPVQPTLQGKPEYDSGFFFGQEDGKIGKKRLSYEYLII